MEAGKGWGWVGGGGIAEKGRREQTMASTVLGGKERQLVQTEAGY